MIQGSKILSFDWTIKNHINFQSCNSFHWIKEGFEQNHFLVETESLKNFTSGLTCTGSFSEISKLNSQRLIFENLFYWIFPSDAQITKLNSSSALDISNNSDILKERIKYNW